MRSWPQLQGESLNFCQNTFPFTVLVKHECGAKEWEDCLPNWHEVPRDSPNSFKAFHVTFITNVNRHVAEYETRPTSGYWFFPVYLCIPIVTVICSKRQKIIYNIVPKYLLLKITFPSLFIVNFKFLGKRFVGVNYFLKNYSMMWVLHTANLRKLYAT